jgi:hypothetical protein
MLQAVLIFDSLLMISEFRAYFRGWSRSGFIGEEEHLLLEENSNTLDQTFIHSQVSSVCYLVVQCGPE